MTPRWSRPMKGERQPRRTRLTPAESRWCDIALAKLSAMRAAALRVDRIREAMKARTAC